MSWYEQVSFEKTITIGDLLTIVIILITITLYFTSRRAEKNLQRATFVRDYTMRFYEIPDLSLIFYEIDYGKFKFDEKILGTENEIRLVMLLDILNSLSFNVANKVIHPDDIDKTTLGYAIVRTYLNPEVQKYLQHLDKHSANIKMRVIPFHHFREIGEKLSKKLMID